MMDERKYAFLKAVLGTDGASSLKKAADKYGDLEGAIVPRAIMAWLGVAARNDYEGGLPGVDDSYLDFSKNEDDTYNGAIAIGDGIFPFQNASIFHLAASVALSLGASLDKAENLKDVDMVKLGKSIDVLVRANFLATVELNKALPGPPNAPKVRGVPQAPVAAQKLPPGAAKKPSPQNPVPQHIDSGKMPHPRAEAPTPKHKVPSIKPQLPKPTKTKKSFEIPVDIKNECGECGQPLIKGERFVGCMCFKDLAPYISLEKHVNGHLALSFGKSVDDEAILAILNVLGVNHG